MSGLLVALLLAQADAGTGLDPKDPLYVLCPEAPPSEEVTQAKVDAVPVLLPYLGWRMLHPDRVSRMACLLETCDDSRRRNVKLLNGPQGPAWWGLLIGAVSLGIALGTGFGWLVK